VACHVLSCRTYALCLPREPWLLSAALPSLSTRPPVSSVALSLSTVLYVAGTCGRAPSICVPNPRLHHHPAPHIYLDPPCSRWWGWGAAGILLKLYSKIGQVAESEDGAYKGFQMPMNDAGTESKGFAFIEFVDKKAAAAAVEQTDGHKLDKNHIFSVCRFSEFSRIVEVEDSYTAPPAPQYKERGNLRQWLADPKARDQYVTRFAGDYPHTPIPPNPYPYTPILPTPYLLPPTPIPPTPYPHTPYLLPLNPQACDQLGRAFAVNFHDTSPELSFHAARAELGRAHVRTACHA